jgi:16S rRNA (guanine966-N2)-methyltransferase
MKLRIISGTLSRRYITIDKSAQRFRPTQERVRQAVAETLQTRIPDAKAADFCAGSGAFGIELLSRGARHVDFVESDRLRGNSIERHCEAFGVGERSRVITQDIGRFLNASPGVYDIIFYDPPYEDAALAALVPALTSHLSKGGVLVYERGKKGVPQGDKVSPAEFNFEVRSYGDTAVEYITRRVER